MRSLTGRALTNILTAAAVAASLGSVFSSIGAAQAQACFVYVANNNSTVSIYSVDAATGSLTDAGLASLDPTSSSFSLAVNPAQTFLYVGTNSGHGTWGFAIDADSGALTPLADSPFPLFASLSLAVDLSGRFLIAALGGPNVSSYRIDPDTGGLTFASIVIGGTPWSVTFEPSGQYVYVANVNSNNVSGFHLNADSGELTAVPGSPFTAGANPSRVVADPSGRFLYVSNSNGSNVSAYRIAADTGSLSPLPGSPFPTRPLPAAMVIDPSDSYLYVANFDNIDGFSIDPDTGALAPLQGSPFPGGDSTALDLAMDPSGQYVYAANHDARKLTVLALDAATGTLSLSSMAPSPGLPLAIRLIAAPPDSHNGFARGLTPQNSH